MLKRGDLVLFDRNNHKSLHQGALVQAGADSDLPADRAQSLRHDRRGRLGAPGTRSICASGSAAIRWSRTRAAPTRSGRSAWPASSSRPMTARSTTCARCWRRSATSATTCSGTRPGSATTPSTRCSTATARCGSRTWRPDMPGLFSTQSVHKQGAGLLAGLADPQARRAHPAARSRFVEHKRFNESFLMTCVDLAVLSAVRLARRQREDARGQGGRDAVGPLHRARHRGAQEAARVRPTTTTSTAQAPEEKWFFDPFVPDSGHDQGLETHGRSSRRQPGRACPDRRAQARAAVLELRSEGDVARLRRLRATATRWSTPTSLTLLTPGIDRKTGEYRDFGVPGDGGRQLPARAAGRAGEVRPQQHPLPDDPGRGREQAQHADRQARQVQEPVGPRRAAAGGAADRLCGQQRALRRLHGPPGLQRDARLLPRGERQGAAAPLLPRLELPELAMSPKEAYEALVANEVDYVPLDGGRRTASPRRLR